MQPVARSGPKDIIFLLGAGASAGAGIPTSDQMIGQIEALLASHTNWASYLDLYHHVKSSIYHGFGLQGRFNSDVPYNIENAVDFAGKVTHFTP